jgi:hypothetical protein
MYSRRFRWVSIAALVSVTVLGCADTSWDAARRADTVAAYHQFVRDNPDSNLVPDAEERIAFLRVRNRPSIEAYRDFESTYPLSPMLAELSESMEPLFFDQARDMNTPEAYQAFLTRYPGGTLSQQAEGNLSYVSRVQHNANPSVLRSFLESYPQSDFATEARTTLELIELRRSTTIGSLAVRVDVSANVDEGERVRRGFASMVSEKYQEAGIPVSLIAGGEPIPVNVDAWMHIEYQEVPAPGTFGRRTLISRARVRMYQRDQEEPVWDRVFEASAEHLTQGTHGRDRTVFGNARYAFWYEFFVPVSTWATSKSRVQRIDYSEPVAAIDLVGDRAAVLLEAGGVEYMNVASPLAPRTLQRYRRGRELTRWKGVRVLPKDRAVVFGTNGAELIEFNERASTRLGRWEAPEIGGIHDAAVYGDHTLLLAGNKGLYAVRLESEQPRPHRLIEGDLVGVEVQAPFVYLVGPELLQIAKPNQLLSHLTGTKIPLGDRLKTYKSRVSNGSLYLFGETAIVQFSMADPARPQPVAQMDVSELGELSDLADYGPKLYLLGQRGIQVSSPAGRWVSDFIQVDGDTAMASKGRFLFVAGNESLEIVDLSPYQVGLASPAE